MSRSGSGSPTTTWPPSSTSWRRRWTTGGEWVHYGLTSSDVLDTAGGVIMAEAGAILIEKISCPVRRREGPGPRPSEDRDGRSHPRDLGRADLVRAQAGWLGVRAGAGPPTPERGDRQRSRSARSRGRSGPTPTLPAPSRSRSAPGSACNPSRPRPRSPPATAMPSFSRPSP